MLIWFVLIWCALGHMAVVELRAICLLTRMAFIKARRKAVPGSGV